MKLKLVIALSLIAVAAASWFHMDRTQQERCIDWFEVAEDLNRNNYYGAAIEKLTLYFTSEDCRGRNDPAAVALLTKARLKVPLPGNAHLAQQLMLSRHGWQLKRDPDHFLRLASASLAAGDWVQALSAAKRAEGGKAALIGLASAIYLGMEDAVTEQHDRLENSDASEFQRTIASLLMKKPAPVSMTNTVYQQFARKVLNPNQHTFSEEQIEVIKSRLSDDDLAFSSSILSRKGDINLAVKLLDQPQRPLPSNLLERLANLLFITDQHHKLALSFTRRSTQEVMPARALFIVCMAQIKLEHRCETGFNQADYSQRYGIFAASRWARLFEVLVNETFEPAQILDLLEAMPDLLAGSGIASLLKSELYDQLGERELAGEMLRLAQAYGYSEQSILNVSAPPASDCRATDTSCFSKTLDENPYDLSRWRRALDNGFKPTKRQADLLQTLSPNSGTMWRTVHAQLKLGKAKPEHDAAALNLLRPVLKTAPTQSTPHLLAATATARFKDMDTAFLHLTNAVKVSPERSIDALRLSLGYYETNNGLTEESLVRWWQKLTHLEMAARGVQSRSDQIKSLLQDRLRILASYCENMKKPKLCVQTYRALLETQPENHMALNNLAYTFYKLKSNLDEAVELANQAVLLAPDISAYKETRDDIQEAVEAASG